MDKNLYGVQIILFVTTRNQGDYFTFTFFTTEHKTSTVYLEFGYVAYATDNANVCA